mmetsp:Transcript_87588/g.228553  ORF Transcript_87588/g.228553 Transcript_87588/m.228553 type:complete len:92 (+) Transcript_87588:43-318(+)
MTNISGGAKLQLRKANTTTEHTRTRQNRDREIATPGQCQWSTCASSSIDWTHFSGTVISMLARAPERAGRTTCFFKVPRRNREPWAEERLG